VRTSGSSSGERRSPIFAEITCFFPVNRELRRGQTGSPETACTANKSHALGVLQTPK
jgi:hypothetical protein